MEVQSACLVVNARRATCACCQQCCWCKHRSAALPGGVPGLPEALLWGFVFVGSLGSPKQLWVTHSACSPSPCGLEQLKQGIRSRAQRGCCCSPWPSVRPWISFAQRAGCAN